MPIEIKELVIRATVDSQAGTAGSAREGAPQRRPAGAGQDVEEIVQACVEQVMEILRRERER